MKFTTLALAAVAAVAAVPASAAMYTFQYQSTTSLFGAPPQTLTGTFTTSDTSVQRFGETAFEITGITGMLNNQTITGLFTIPNNRYYYFTTGGTFLDGSGVRFNTNQFTNVAFFQPSVGPADQYRINGGGGISTLGNASSQLVGGAVPEPATWLMLILGFGAVGAGLRRAAKVRTSFAYA